MAAKASSNVTTLLVRQAPSVASGRSPRGSIQFRAKSNQRTSASTIGASLYAKTGRNRFKSSPRSSTTWSSSTIGAKVEPTPVELVETSGVSTSSTTVVRTSSTTAQAPSVTLMLPVEVVAVSVSWGEATWLLRLSDGGAPGPANLMLPVLVWTE